MALHSSIPICWFPIPVPFLPRVPDPLDHGLCVPILRLFSGKKSCQSFNISYILRSVKTMSLGLPPEKITECCENEKAKNNTFGVQVLTIDQYQSVCLKQELVRACFYFFSASFIAWTTAYVIRLASFYQAGVDNSARIKQIAWNIANILSQTLRKLRYIQQNLNLFLCRPMEVWQDFASSRNF